MTTEPAPNVLPFTVAGPITSIVCITPATATEWLLRNTNNRPIRRKVLASYIRDMRTGRWQLTGEAIKFAVDGSLLDGQHRLEAVVRSGVTVQMFVICGLSPNTRDVMDTGAKRTTADALRMNGEQQSVPLAAGARIALRFERDAADDRAPGIISSAEAIAWIGAHPALRDAVELTRPLLRELPVPQGVLVYVAWRLASIDAAAAHDFIRQVALLDGVARTDPRWVLNQRLRKMRETRTTDTPAGYLDLFFQAWNRWRDGRTATYFRVSRNGLGHVALTEPH